MYVALDVVSSFSVVESSELPLDRAPGTDRNVCGFPCDVGEETLCGEVGRLSLLSKEFEGRSSDCGGRCCVGDGSAWSSTECGADDVCSSDSRLSGTESDISGSLGLTAEVSMVMVGARVLREVPSEATSCELGSVLSAMMEGGYSAECRGCKGREGCAAWPSDGMRVK